MKMNRGNFAQLLVPKHKEIIWNSYFELEPEYLELFFEGQLDMKSETIPHEGGFGLWSSNTEGNTINEDSMSEGALSTLTANRYDKGYSLTWELVKDDQHNGFKNVINGQGKGGSATDLGYGLRETIDTGCGNVINNGFANTGYDTVSLFNDAHPLAEGGTGDNLITGVLNPANIQAALSNLRGHVNEAGLKVRARADILWCGPANEWLAYEALGLPNGNKSMELSNTPNVLPKLRPVVNDFISLTKWGVKDSRFKNLGFYWREKPIFDAQPIPKTIDWFLYGYSRWIESYINWRGIVGSLGT
jgi:hypothetical protein